MARPRVVFHPKAAEDYDEAFAWYSARSRSVAADFEREIGRALRLIRDSPHLGPLFDSSRRRMIVRKFPYSLIYEVVGRELVIFAVAHGGRRPYYWRRRTRRRD